MNKWSDVDGTQHLIVDRFHGGWVTSCGKLATKTPPPSVVFDKVCEPCRANPDAPELSEQPVHPE